MTRAEKRRWRRRVCRAAYTSNEQRGLTFYWRSDGTTAWAIYDRDRRIIVAPWDRPTTEQG